MSFEERIKQAKLMRDLCVEFEHVAKKFGKKIIEELNVPVHKRTIPAQKEMGLAGGDKYIVVRL